MNCNIKLREFNGVFDTLTQRLQYDTENLQYTPIKTYHYQLKKGYNKFDEIPFKIYKKLAVVLYTISDNYNCIDYENSSQTTYSDYKFLFFHPYVRLNPVINYRYYVRALIKNDYNYGSIKITKQYLVSNNYTISVQLVKNDFNAQTSQLVNIYKGCVQPNITIEQFYTPFSPYQIVRSKLLALTSITYIICDTAYTTEYTWTGNLLNSTDFQPIRALNLTSLANTKKSTLVVPENSLNYGLYEFRLEFVVRYGTAGSKHKSAEAVTYYEVIPTGLAVIAIGSSVNSVSSVTIGSGGMFTLKPALYTIDYDNLTEASKLDFTYYCRTVDLTQPNVNSYSTTDLYTLKVLNQSMNRNISCFGSPSKLFIIMPYKSLI